MADAPTPAATPGPPTAPAAGASGQQPQGVLQQPVVPPRLAPPFLYRDANFIYGRQISDHLPQVYMPPHLAGVQILTWNVMSLCRYAGGTKTNNGFNKNESPQDYERRILNEVAQIVAQFIAERNPAGCIVLLQEATTSPALQNGFLQSICTLANRPLGISAQPITPVFANLTIFDSTYFKKVHDGAISQRVLFTDLVATSTRRHFRVLNTHLQYVGNEGASQESNAQFREHVQRIGELFHWVMGISPKNWPVVIAGDLKIDPVHLTSLPQLETLSPTPATQFIPQSCRSIAPDGITAVEASNDACISGLGTGTIDHSDLAQLPKMVSQRQIITPGIDAQQQQQLFFGKTREQFIQEHINRRLQQQAAMLPNDRLFQLGKVSFQQQIANIQFIMAGAMPMLQQPVPGPMSQQMGPMHMHPPLPQQSQPPPQMSVIAAPPNPTTTSKQ